MTVHGHALFPAHRKTSSSSHLRHAGSPALRLSTRTEKTNLGSLSNRVFLFFFFLIKINMEFSNKCECYEATASAILSWHLESESVHQAVVSDDSGVRPQKQTGIRCTTTALGNCRVHAQSLWRHCSRICDQISALGYTIWVTSGKLFNVSEPHDPRL